MPPDREAKRWFPGDRNRRTRKGGGERGRIELLEQQYRRASRVQNACSHKLKTLTLSTYILEYLRCNSVPNRGNQCRNDVAIYAPIVMGSFSSYHTMLHCCSSPYCRNYGRACVRSSRDFEKKTASPNARRSLSDTRDQSGDTDTIDRILPPIGNSLRCPPLSLSRASREPYTNPGDFFFFVHCLHAYP